MKLICVCQKTWKMGFINEQNTCAQMLATTGIKLSTHWSLWVWERALVPRGSSFKKAKLQRRIATTSYLTKNKKNHGVPPVQLRPGINICLNTTDPCLPIIARKCNDAYCSWSRQLVPIIRAPADREVFIKDSGFTRPGSGVTVLGLHCAHWPGRGPCLAETVWAGSRERFLVLFRNG